MCVCVCARACLCVGVLRWGGGGGGGGGGGLEAGHLVHRTFERWHVFARGQLGLGARAHVHRHGARVQCE